MWTPLVFPRRVGVSVTAPRVSVPRSPKAGLRMGTVLLTQLILVESRTTKARLTLNFWWRVSRNKARTQKERKNITCMDLTS